MKLTKQLPTINTRFVLSALAAAAVVAVARYAIMKAPTNQITAPVKKVAEVL